MRLLSGGNVAPYAQAALVRALKEDHGLGNDDPDVADAVAALLRRKARLQALRDRAAAARAAVAEGDSAEAAAPAQA